MSGRTYTPGESAEPARVPLYSEVVAGLRESYKRAGVSAWRERAESDASRWFADRIAELQRQRAEYEARAEDGPAHCSCWTPIYDARQRKPKVSVEPVVRDKACVDCAYRQGSPERERGEDLEGLPNFWCHQGIRRPAAYRHPDGRVRPVPDYAASPDYQPPMLSGVPYRANGKPADRCAGWASTQAGKLVPVELARVAR